MKAKLLLIVLIMLIFSFIKKDINVSDKANEYMDYCNEHKIKAGAFYEVKGDGDSLHRVVLKNFR